MTEAEAQGAGLAAWLLARALAVELATAEAIPPKRLRKVVSHLLEAVADLDQAGDLPGETRSAARRRLEELRRAPALNVGGATRLD